METKYHELVALMEKHNVPANNFNLVRQIPAQVIELFEILIDGDYCERSKLIHRLYKDVKIDDARISKSDVWDITVEKKKGLVFETFPKLKAELKDDLYKLEASSTINKSGFRYKDSYLIFPNVFSQNFHLTEWMIANVNKQMELSLPIDRNTLGIVGTENQTCLRSHWRGPQNLNGLRSKKPKAARTLLGPERNIIKGIFDLTEFYFVFRDGQWHLEIEEFMPHWGGLFQSHEVSIYDVEMNYCMRYLHAITNADLTECFHMDGAIREYTSYENYLSRHLHKNNTDLKNLSRRHKLFRVDSTVKEKGLSNYQEIIGLFFMQNPYVMEFFEGETQESKILEAHRTDMAEYREQELQNSFIS